MNAENVRSEPWLGVVAPGGWMDGLLRRVSNPRRSRWNKYLRLCKRIPAGSPVAGSTSLDKLEDRRCELIEKEFGGGGRTVDEEVEFRVLQRATGVARTGGVVAMNLCLARQLRRFRKLVEREGATSPSSGDQV